MGRHFVMVTYQMLQSKCELRIERDATATLDLVMMDHAAVLVERILQRVNEGTIVDAAAVCLALPLPPDFGWTRTIFAADVQRFLRSSAVRARKWDAGALHALAVRCDHYFTRVAQNAIDRVLAAGRITLSATDVKAHTF